MGLNGYSFQCMGWKTFDPGAWSVKKLDVGKQLLRLPGDRKHMGGRQSKALQ